METSEKETFLQQCELAPGSLRVIVDKGPSRNCKYVCVINEEKMTLRKTAWPPTLIHVPG